MIFETADEFLKEVFSDQFWHDSDRTNTILKRYTSNQSLNSIWSENSYLSEDARLALQSKRRSDGEFSLTLSNINSERHPDNIMKQRVLELQQFLNRVFDQITELRSKSNDLDSKRRLFGLVRQYKSILIRPCMYFPRDDLISTATVTIKKVHFATISPKFGQNSFFILITDGFHVYVSNYIKTDKRFLTFDDVFQFTNLTSDFVLDVQLYSIKFQAKLRNFVKNNIWLKRYWKSGRSTCPPVLESSSFQLLEEFQISRDDLRADTTFGTISRKQNDYKFSLHVDHVNVNLKRSGFIDLYDNVEKLWANRWCEIQHGQFDIYKNPNDLQPIQTFNLRYCTMARIVDNLIVFKTVRPRTECDSDDLIALKSHDNFVIEEYKLRSNYKGCLKWWQEALNEIVSDLVDWKYSFLTSDEIYM